jgi:protein-ribulosamine 3-kinase
VESLSPLAAEISRACGVRCAPQPRSRVAGGSINDCYCWPTDGAPLFVKVGGAQALTMFEAEAEGLAELGSARALRVPRVLSCGRAAESAFLALEWLEAGVADAACEARLGAGLAALHAICGGEFGWRRDNTIGSTPQPNAPLTSWAEFFRERRLRPQLARAVAGGFGALVEGPGEQLLAAVGSLLGQHRPAASLLHGDLWGGNWLATRDGEPAVFDPAVYYGDRETDLAMTRLFGGFGTRFHEAYAAAAPLPAGFEVRRELYNLYHVLNHANLFGGGYALTARDIIGRLLAEVRG